MKAQPAIVIGTPSRIKDLVNRKLLSLKKLRYFVLDESDKLLTYAGTCDREERVFKIIISI